MDVVGHVNTEVAGRLLLPIMKMKDNCGDKITYPNQLKNVTITTERVVKGINRAVKGIGRIDHARLCYAAGICPWWDAFRTLFGRGPARTSETYVKICSAFGIMSKEDALLLGATSLLFIKVDNETGQFIFRNQSGCEIAMHNLHELGKCRYLTDLTINAAAGVKEISIMRLSNLVNLNVVNCDGLKTLELPTAERCRDPKLQYLNISGSGISEINVSNFRGFQRLYADSCPNLRSISVGNLHTFYDSALQFVHARGNPSLERVSIFGKTPNCKTFNFCDCPNLSDIWIRPNKFNCVPTFNLTGCHKLSSETQKSLNAVQGEKYVYMDEFRPEEEPFS
jgi:hypothetical protein